MRQRLDRARSQRRAVAPAGVFLALVVVLLPLVAAFAATPAGGGAPAPAPPVRAEVLHARVRSIIQPVVAEYLVDAIHEADTRRAAALVVELDTPGGLLTSTREIFSAMLGARTPVVVFVGPAGAQAASAGFFLLMASDVAAMAPGTNTGAAHPVGGQGETIEGTMGEKVEQDAAATIRSLAARNGRNAALAEAAVVKSRSFSAQEAKDAGLVEVLAPDVPALLLAIDGRPVPKLGAGAVLHTRGAAVREIEMTAAQRFRSTIVHPNVAYLLLTLGGLGLYFELATPGAVLPGVVGGIALILAFYALSVLPVSYAGVALMILSAIFFLAEIKVPSHGMLTIGGLISLFLGSVMLFRTPDPAIRVSLSVIFTMVGVAAIVGFFLATLGVRAQRSPVRTGLEGLVGERGTVRSSVVGVAGAPRSKVFVHGEIWDAVSETALGIGEAVEVIAAEGMLLRVRPARPLVAADVERPAHSVREEMR